MCVCVYVCVCVCVWVCGCVCVCVCVCVIVTINFKPIHFLSYGNLKVIFETATTFRHLPFPSFIMTSSNIRIQGLLAVKFYNFALEIN